MTIDSASVAGEFVGTAILVLLGDGVVAGALLARSKAQNAGWICITAAWALAVFAGIFVAAALGDKDGHLNPASTVASVLMTGHPERLFTYIPAQLLGAFTGGTLVWIFYLPHWRVTESTANKLGCFCTTPAIRSLGSNFICEVIGTFVLILVATSFSSKRIAPVGIPPGIGPVLVGGLVWSIGLSLGGTTGYAINPARDFGPRLAHTLLPIAGKGNSDWPYAWVPILGPLCGASLAALFINWSGMQ
jgi:glycerol uptake facilitator protein